VQSSRDRTTVVANRVSPERDALKSMSIRTDAADEDDYLFIIPGRNAVEIGRRYDGACIGCHCVHRVYWRLSARLLRDKD